VSISKTFLGLLEDGPSHGYDLKREYDARFGIDRPVAYGQVYATLSRLLKHGLVTADGVADVERWLAEPEKPDLYLQSTLYAKVVIALRSGRAAIEILDTQRGEHLRLMRELIRRKTGGTLVDQLVCDHALFHLEADLRWLELTAARLDELAGEVAL
jgi:hypothetical protein